MEDEYPFKSYQHVLRDATTIQAISYYLTSLNPNIVYSALDISVPARQLMRLMCSGSLALGETFQIVVVDLPNLGLPDTKESDFHAKICKVFSSVLSVSRISEKDSFYGGVSTFGVNILRNRLILSLSSEALKSGHDVVMPYIDYMDENGHAMFLFISGKTIEVWDPDSPSRLLNTIREAMIKQVFARLPENEMGGEYTVKMMSNLYDQCPQTGKFLGPQAKQILERRGFRGSCLTWNIWLMGLRAARGPLTKAVFDRALQSIQNDHQSFTNFITRFAKFFEANESVFDNREEMLKRIRQSNLFPLNSLCSNCNASFAIGMCGGCDDTAYCSDACGEEHWEAGHSQNH